MHRPTWATGDTGFKMDNTFSAPLIESEYYELAARGSEAAGHRVSQMQIETAASTAKRNPFAGLAVRRGSAPEGFLAHVMAASGLEHGSSGKEPVETHDEMLERHDNMTHNEVHAEFTAPNADDSPEQAECKRLLAEAKTEKVREVLKKLLHDLEPKQKRSYSVQLAFAFVVLVRGSLNVFLTMAGKKFPTQSLYMLRTPLTIVTFGPAILYNYYTSSEYQKNFTIAFSDSKTYKKVFIFAMLQTVIPFNCLSYSLQYIEAGVGSVLMACLPLATVALKQIPWVKAMEKNPKPLTLMNITGMSLGLFGVLLCVMGNSNRASNVALADVMLGYILYVFAVLSWACAGVYWSYNKGKVHFLPGGLAQGIVMGCWATLGSFLIEYSSPPLIPRSDPPEHFSKHLAFIGEESSEFSFWLPLVWMGVVSGFGVVSCYFFLMGQIGPADASKVTTLVPVVGMLEGIIFFHEWGGPWYLKGMEILGALCVVFGLIISAKK